MKERIIIRHNLKQIPKARELEQMANNDSCFGRYMSIIKEIEAWKNSAGVKVVTISVKRRTHAAAIKEFRDLYQPKNYFVRWNQGTLYRDDSIDVYYTERM